MALVQSFDKLELENSKLHLPAVAKLGVFKRDGRAFVQINTYGRPDRKYPEKESQSLQLNEHSARQLIAALKDAFPNI